jgi:hypothetical protein
MPRKRITLSLDADSPSDKAILDFLSGLPRRTRSEIIKEILLDAMERQETRAEINASPPDIVRSPQALDPDEIIEKLF